MLHLQKIISITKLNNQLNDTFILIIFEIAIKLLKLEY